VSNGNPNLEIQHEPIYPATALWPSALSALENEFPALASSSPARPPQMIDRLPPGSLVPIATLQVGGTGKRYGVRRDA